MSSQKIYGLCGLKHHIVDIRDHVTRRDGRTNKQTNEQGKIGLLSQWKLEAEFRNLVSQVTIFYTAENINGHILHC